MAKGPRRGITFDEALAVRDAATTVTVDAAAIPAAEALARDYPDPRNLDAQGRGDTSVGIDQFVRTNAPPILPPEKSSFTATLKSDFVSDPETKRRLIAKTLFPNDPEGHKRIGIIDGDPVYVDDQGQLRKVANGWDRFGAAVASNLPEMVMGGIGSVSSSPVIGGAMGAAGARGIKRGIAGLLTDEPQTVKGNLAEMATEGVVSTAAGGVGKAIGAVAGRGKVVDFTPSDVKTAVQAREAIKNSTGIDVDLAQASGNNKLIALRAYAARFPGKSAELVQAAEEVQKGQLDQAVNRVLNQIATSAPSEVAGARGINAAGAVLELARGVRDKAVAPLYEAAGKVALSADVVADVSKDPLIARAAKRVSVDPVYARKLQGSRPDSVAYWHQVKRNLDAGYEAAASAGNKTVAREYADAAASLNNKLKAASPEYATANQEFAKATREIVEPLENSAVGAISRIKNPKAATVAAKIFNDPNITAAEIRATRASIEKVDPEAWNGLVRQWMAQGWNKALKVTQTGESVNPAGKLRQALVGTPEQRAKAAAMMPTGSLQAFEDLMNASKALSRTPTAGSNTMRDTEIANQLKGQGGVILKWLTSPRASMTSAAEQRAVEKNTIALTEAIIDPAKQKQLRVIVKMSDRAKQAIALSALLSGKGASMAVDSDVDHTPDVLQR